MFLRGFVKSAPQGKNGSNVRFSVSTFIFQKPRNSSLIIFATEVLQKNTFFWNWLNFSWVRNSNYERQKFWSCIKCLKRDATSAKIHVAQCKVSRFFLKFLFYQITKWSGIFLYNFIHLKLMVTVDCKYLQYRPDPK